MFSGIVQQQIRIRTKEVWQKGLRFHCTFPKNVEMVPGQSVLLSGICSTVVDVNDVTFTIECMPETRKLTTVDSWKEGQKLHYEPSLRVGDPVDGHFVFGHVDGIGKVKSLHKHLGSLGEGIELCIQSPEELDPYIAKKGSIAIDGVSLTVSQKKSGEFSIELIPYTLEKTHLGNLGEGDSINIEVDMLARYARQVMQSIGFKQGL